MVDISVRRRHMIEAGIKVARERADIFIEMIRIKNLCQPPQPDQPIDGRREIDPTEGELRRQIDVAVADRFYLRPLRIAPHGISEVAIYGDDHLRIPYEHLFDRYCG